MSFANLMLVIKIVMKEKPNFVDDGHVKIKID